ncbi:MAG: DEAD/DEAH box helicase [Chloroflexota bacterium]
MTRQVLRPFQVDIGDDVRREWTRGVQRVAAVLPTGGGKTTIFVDIAERWLADNPGRRVVVIAHRTELIEAAAARVQAHTGLAVGVVKAERNQTRAPIVVASVQTLASREGRRARQIADVGLVIIDECHRAAARSYRDALGAFGAMGRGVEGGAVALGVTATLSRSDRLSLGAVWESVVEGPTIMDMRRDGWLVPPSGLFVRVDDLNMARVRTSGGDYREGDLGEAIESSLAPKKIAEAYREHCPGRQGIVFAPTVSSAGVICEALVEAGFTAVLVHGGTPAGERADAVAAYRRGETQILVNCSIFTEGTDLPMTGVVVIARPTKSNGLYVQMVGRGLRLWCFTHGELNNLLEPCCGDVKPDCLVLDVVGASKRHRLQAQIDLFGEDVIPEPKEPEDILELEDEGEEIADDLDTSWIEGTGVLVAQVVDLFHSSGAGWARTAAGAWFLPTKHRYLCVLPTLVAGAYGFDVWSVPKSAAEAWQNVAWARDDLAQARTLAEAQVQSGERISQDRYGWRRAAPSQNTLRLATRLGVETEGRLGGEVSAGIDRALATGRIDPYLTPQMMGITV